MPRRIAFAPLLGLLGACREDATPASAPAPAARFVDEAQCAQCHAHEARSWKGSHHDLAMQVANEETVLGDFADARFEQAGVVTRFFRRDDGYFVEAEGPDGKPAEFAVAYVFGVEPLQQLLLRFPDGKLQCLTVAWDVRAQRWFSLYPNERILPSDPLHWTGLYQRWNSMCADCHSTDLARNYDLAHDAYATSFASLDVGCQACHGPGSLHVEHARQGAAYDPRASGLTTALRRGAQREQLDACAPCHSRRIRLTATSAPSTPFLDAFLPERLVAPDYYPDGQLLEENYEWGSFVQSKMHERGVACTDCHEPHGLGLLAPGDGVCLQCHAETPPLERFPTLQAKRYDTPEHHHHLQDSEGARCVACHMPARTYMVVDPRHDHSLRIPRPDLAQDLGTPDACTSCHAERTAAWAAETLDQWFGAHERPRTFAPAFAAARNADPRVLNELARIARDPASPAIVRATAVELFRRYPSALGAEPLASALGAALADPDGLVRASAVEGLDLLPPGRRPPLAGPLLADPVRAVRVEAARVLAAAEGRLGPAERAAFGRAAAEFLAAQEAQADMPWSHLNRGVFAADRGDQAGAEAAYRTALRLDPTFMPARFNLANLLNAGHRNAEAEQTLRAGLAHAPDAVGEGELQFALGLLLAEEKRFDQAAAALARASELVPDRPRVFTNLGLALHALGRDTEAESALWHARSHDASDADALQVLAQLALARGDRDQALALAEELARLLPGEPWVGELVRRIRAGG